MRFQYGILGTVKALREHKTRVMGREKVLILKANALCTDRERGWEGAIF